MRPRKFNFIPVGHFKEPEKKSEYRASFNPKYGRLTFSIQYATDKGLDGNFLKIFMDQHGKALSWKKWEGGSWGRRRWTSSRW